MYSYELSRQQEYLEQLEIDFDQHQEYCSNAYEELFNRIEQLEEDVDMLVKELKKKKPSNEDVSFSKKKRGVK